MKEPATGAAHSARYQRPSRAASDRASRGDDRYSEFVAAMTIRFVFLPPRLVSGVRGLLF
jgi:hypothetical protein